MANRIPYHTTYREREILSITLCPYGTTSTTTGETLRVGGIGCRLCKHFKEEINRVVTCTNKQEK